MAGSAHAESFEARNFATLEKKLSARFSFAFSPGRRTQAMDLHPESSVSGNKSDGRTLHIYSLQPELLQYICSFILPRPLALVVSRVSKRFHRAAMSAITRTPFFADELLPHRVDALLKIYPSLTELKLRNAACVIERFDLIYSESPAKIVQEAVRIIQRGQPRTALSALAFNTFEKTSLRESAQTLQRLELYCYGPLARSEIGFFSSLPAPQLQSLSFAAAIANIEVIYALWHCIASSVASQLTQLRIRLDDFSDVELTAAELCFPKLKDLTINVTRIEDIPPYIMSTIPQLSHFSLISVLDLFFLVYFCITDLCSSHRCSKFVQSCHACQT